ncbi:hypothetical protein B296_00052659 [Ensete ventricosum]|uniref:Uncharacterized protein n=1 Tax=Ensete ventricosum TaxID=4639 RepID=A0A426XD44_ENSVE|nr:hypothetical protein B296_00052659 [Ensete ventricosum]
MHPLRFPNSGIRAKATRRRGSRAWPHHLHRGRSVAAKAPLQGAGDCIQAPYKGRPSAGEAARKARLLAEATATRGHDRLWPGPL